MIKGLTNSEYKIIKSILKDYCGDFFAYGSRVKGDYSELSDLDILIKSKMSDKIIPELKTRFDNSYLPFVVNFTDFNSIDEKFYNLIKNDLVKINK